LVVCLLFLLPLLLFGGVLIAASIEIDFMSSPKHWFYHNSNYNMNSAVQSYVDGFHQFTPASAPPSPAHGNGATAWDACGHTDNWFEAIANAGPGALDDIAHYDYAYSSPDRNPPWQTGRNFSWSHSFGWDTIYSMARVSACYGSEIDKASLRDAQVEQDLCLIEISTVKACAPGWSRATFQKSLCDHFTACNKKFDADVERWIVFGAVNVTKADSQQEFELPADWNNEDKIKSYLKEWESKALTDELLLPGPIWLAVNAALLAIGLSGWVAIVGWSVFFLWGTTTHFFSRF
jgi:hypothetical protein